MKESEKLIDNILNKQFTNDGGAMDNFNNLIRQQIALKLPDIKNKIASQMFKFSNEEE